MQDFDRASKAFKVCYGINLENKEHALKGWNWGKAEFGKAELAFNVQNRPAFELPYTEISNTNLAGKNEVAIEFNLAPEASANGANGHKVGSTKNRGRKAAAGRDELVEMRFYIPGTVVKKEKDDADRESGEEEEEEEEGEEQNAATLFYDTLMDKAEIGEVAGDSFTTFRDVLHLTPRYDLVGDWLRFETDLSTVAVSTLIFTKAHSDYEARLTITRFNTSRSRSVFTSQKTTRCIN